MVNYLISFYEKRDLDAEMKKLLQDHLAYLTPTTVWLLGLGEFWLMPTQMAVRLKASLTIYDRFEGSTNHLLNFAAGLKSPTTLADAWLKAVIRRMAPLSW